jgi:urease accessory protein
MIARPTVRTLVAIAGCTLPLAAFAHPGHHEAGFFDGFAHPFGGLDHLLAMVAVGILAMRFEGARRWLLPICFLAAMVAGALLGHGGTALPYTEPLIAVSLVVFGGCIALSRAPHFVLAAVVVAAFAVFHGHAHGQEMGAGSLSAYSAGFLLATAALHGAGVALATIAYAHALEARVRLAGGAVALAGIALLGASV